MPLQRNAFESKKKIDECHFDSFIEFQETFFLIKF
jgi:hypothetical protein